MTKTEQMGVVSRNFVKILAEVMDVPYLELYKKYLCCYLGVENTLFSITYLVNSTVEGYYNNSNGPLYFNLCNFFDVSRMCDQINSPVVIYKTAEKYNRCIFDNRVLYALSEKCTKTCLYLMIDADHMLHILPIFEANNPFNIFGLGEVQLGSFYNNDFETTLLNLCKNVNNYNICATPSSNVYISFIRSLTQNECTVLESYLSHSNLNMHIFVFSYQNPFVKVTYKSPPKQYLFTHLVELNANGTSDTIYCCLLQCGRGAFLLNKQRGETILNRQHKWLHSFKPKTLPKYINSVNQQLYDNDTTGCNCKVCLESSLYVQHMKTKGPQQRVTIKHTVIDYCKII